VVDQNGTSSTFEAVVFACHPDQALEILSTSATEEEREVLGAFKYSPNDTYVHTDAALMPKSRAAWTSWNYMGTTKSDGLQKPVYVTYWLNKLQRLNHPRDIFVSLNPSTPPAPDKVLSRINYAHPQYTTKSVQAQRKVVDLQGKNGTYYCG
jgi:predicted NAD/FAD-binding protein